MIREIWKLTRNFVSSVIGVIWHGITVKRRELLLSLAIIFMILAAFMTVMLKYTATPEFCGSCHNMQSYIDSWRESSHKHVPCTDCHFEPGFFGAIEGKWKAQAHIVMKLTNTAPSRPHTQISDDSCLRNGCHTPDKLSEKAVVFKGVEFKHGSHLGDLRRGKKLRCVSCHSQIVQGQHLTITETTCFTCHFYGGDRNTKMAECSVCHKSSKDKIYIDANESQPFVHKEYLDRGVKCSQCHFDIVSGDGHLKDNICVQCHADPGLLSAPHDTDDIHRNHITEHKVECYRCHSAIEHGIIRIDNPDLSGPGHEAPSAKKSSFVGNPLDTNCAKCHTFDKHKAKRLMYMGKGAEEVDSIRSPMYAAHADCGSCHIALETSISESEPDARLKFEEAVKSCSDCHGAGYDAMARHWKKLLTEETVKTEAALASARAIIASGGMSKEKAADAKKVIGVAERNLQFVKNGRGLHNIEYALKILADAQERAEKVKTIQIPSYAAKKITPPDGCVQLCHSCVECIETKPVPFGNVRFPHDVHVKDEGLDCLECHTPRSQHGGLVMKNCNECHHGSGTGSVTCQDCHVANFNLYNGQNACNESDCDVRGAKNSMAADVKCTECHVAVSKNKPQTLDAVKQTCIDCHDKSYGPMVDAWLAEAKTFDIAGAEKRLKDVQSMVLKRIREGYYTYDAQDILNNAEKNLKTIKEGNPVHNLAFTKDLLTRVNDLVAKAEKVLMSHSTIKTLTPQDGLKH